MKKVETIFKKQKKMKKRKRKENEIIKCKKEMENIKNHN